MIKCFPENFYWLMAFQESSIDQGLLSTAVFTEELLMFFNFQKKAKISPLFFWRSSMGLLLAEIPLKIFYGWKTYQRDPSANREPSKLPFQTEDIPNFFNVGHYNVVSHHFFFFVVVLHCFNIEISMNFFSKNRTKMSKSISDCGHHQFNL